MGEEINAAKIQARRIVEQRQDSPMEPTSYVLVPFHDPGSIDLQGLREGGPPGHSTCVVSEPLLGTCVCIEDSQSAVSAVSEMVPV